MKMLVLLLAAALALAIAGPVLASQDDYPQLWTGTSLVAAGATTTLAAAKTAPAEPAARATPCPVACQCPAMRAAAHQAKQPARGGNGGIQVAQRKPLTWEEIIPYNY
jgi:hypothetical protein